MQNASWDKKADEQLADRNSSKGFFAAIQQVYGPQKTAVVPIRDADHKCSQRNQQLCLGWRSILASYWIAQQLPEKKYLRQLIYTQSRETWQTHQHQRKS